MLNVTINERRLIAAVAAAWASGKPADPEATYPESPEVWLQETVERACRSYREQFGPDRLSVADFILRAADRFPAIVAAADSDPIIAGFLARLRSESHVWLASDEVQMAVGYLTQAGYLTPAEAEALLAYDIAGA